VTTASAAVAVQIVYASRRGSRSIERLDFGMIRNGLIESAADLYRPWRHQCPESQNISHRILC
jgi:hypothetical protein